jgi:putative membrane protein
VLLTLSAAGALAIAAPTVGYAQGAQTAIPSSVIEVRQDSDEIADDETAFIRTAVSDAATEIEAADLADDRAGSSEIRDFADRVRDEHRTIMDDAAEIADDNGVPAPQAPTDDDEMALIDDLEDLNGDEFDETYLRAFVHDQRAAIADFESARTNYQNNLAEFADRHLGTLQQQLEDAEDLADRLDIFMVLS